MPNSLMLAKAVVAFVLERAFRSCRNQAILEFACHVDLLSLVRLRSNPALVRTGLTARRTALR